MGPRLIFAPGRVTWAWYRRKGPRRVGGVLHLLVAVVVLLTGCGVAEGPVQRGPATSPSDIDRSLPKRIVVAMVGAPSSPVAHFTPGSPPPGLESLEAVTNAGLVQFTDSGQLRPQIAEAVPSFEDGSWRVLPDGRVATSWRFRPGAAWHDGTHVSVDDVRFTIQVGSDPELPQLHDPAYGLIDELQATDQQSFTVIWKGPYAKADLLFSHQPGGSHYLLPSHRLAGVYAAGARALLGDAYWSTEFTGTGPYWLLRWVAGRGAFFEAFDGYFLGPPVIDAIEVRFVSDASALSQAVLGGAVDVALDQVLDPAVVNHLREQWRRGKPIGTPFGVTLLVPLASPTHSDLNLRLGLQLALDRRSMAERLFSEGIVADTFVVPGGPDYGAVARGVQPIAYDAARAQRLLDDLGYRRGAEGRLQTPAGVALRVGFPSADRTHTDFEGMLGESWSRIGVDTCQMTGADCTLSGAGIAPFAVEHRSTDARDLTWLAPGRQRIPVVRGATGGERLGSEALSAALTQHEVAISATGRMEALARVVASASDELVVLPQHYRVRTALVGERLANVSTTGMATLTWNIDRWNVN